MAEAPAIDRRINATINELGNQLSDADKIRKESKYEAKRRAALDEVMQKYSEKVC